VQSDRTHTQLVKAFLTGCEYIWVVWGNLP